MQAWFVSDLHLKDLNERNSQTLLRFLHSLLASDKATHLFLLGDIFDLWVGDSDVFQKKFQAIVDAIADIKRKGIEVVYFEGNHDVHIKDFWQKHFDIPVWVEHKYFQLGPYKVRLEHGDLMNPEDKAYIRYRDIIRKPLMERVAYLLPGIFLEGAGQWASRTSRKHSSKKRASLEDKLRAMIRVYAQKSFEQESFDYIITGHMHVKDEFLFERNGRSIFSVNLGSWFEEPMALCLEDKGHRWIPLS